MAMGGYNTGLVQKPRWAKYAQDPIKHNTTTNNFIPVLTNTVARLSRSTAADCTQTKQNHDLTLSATQNMKFMQTTIRPIPCWSRSTNITFSIFVWTWVSGPGSLNPS